MAALKCLYNNSSLLLTHGSRLFNCLFLLHSLQRLHEGFCMDMSVTKINSNIFALFQNLNLSVTKHNQFPGKSEI